MQAGLFDVRGKPVGLTGGGGHLGREIALGLSAAGAEVFICGRDSAKLADTVEEAAQRGLEGQITCRSLDAADPVQIEGFMDFILDRSGCMWGWINNAASGVGELQGYMSRQGVNSTLEGCLTQVILCSQAAAVRMARSGGGSIVNIASMYGMVSPDPKMYAGYPQYHNPPAYGAAKAGVLQYTKYAACHLARDGVRVNCISPGAFPGDSVQKEDGFVRELEKRVPLGRTGSPRDLVGPVVFLLSAASDYITGHNLVVDGGWTVW